MSEPALITFWLEFLEWFLARTEKFPKKARFTFSNRMDNLALDILENLTEAAYLPRREKIQVLKSSNRKLERLRILLRLSLQRRYINKTSFEYAIRKLEHGGNMLGGWIKERETS